MIFYKLLRNGINMKTTNKNIALVTGASSGIGKAIYNKLIKHGWTVYGTSRKIEKNSIKSLDGGKMIYLDVNSTSSISDAVQIIKKAEGKLDALINNAGYGIAGAVEDTSYEEMKSQFNTNFFGVMHVTNSFLNMLRESKGIIINISSVAGVLSIPFQGIYSASKAATEAATEALRMELKDQGVRVCLVEPGDTKTGFTANRMMVENSENSRYSNIMTASVEKMEKDEQNGTSPNSVANLVYRMINKKNPPVRRAVGFSYQILVFLKRLLPDNLVLWIIGKMYA